MPSVRLVGVVLVLSLAGCFRVNFDKHAHAHGGHTDEDEQSGDAAGGDGAGGDATGADGEPADGDTCVTAALTVEPVYAAHGDWNQYIRRTSGALDRHHQASVIPCTAGEAGGYEACIHGGLERRAVLTGESSCAGLTASDARQGFVWSCDDSDGTATVFLDRLADGAGLAWLVDSAGFLTNRLEVRRGACLLAASADAVWWANPVHAVPDTSGANVPVALQEAGAVYVVDGDTFANGYNLDADGIAFVVADGATLTFDGGVSAGYCQDSGELVASSDYASLLCTGSQHFLWIEGSFDCNNSNGLYVVSTRMSRLHRMRIDRAQENNLNIDISHGLLIDDILSTNASNGLGQGEGVSLYDSDGITLVDGEFFGNVFSGLDLYQPGLADGDLVVIRRVRAADNEGAGVSAYQQHNTVFVDVLATNNLRGVFIDQCVDIVASHIGSFDNLNEGVLLQYSSHVDLVQTLTAGNVDGLQVAGSGNTDVHVDTLVAADNLGRGVYVAPTAAGMEFDGPLWVGNNGGGDCVVDATPGDNTIDGTCMHGSPAVAATSGVDVSGSFVGKVLADSSNPIDVLGVAGRPTVESYWTRVDNRWRTWSPVTGTPFPSADLAGICSPDCQLWDWSLLQGDTSVRGLGGDFTAGSACPASAAGDVAVAATLAVVQVFLINAREIAGDGRGDDDGLCESSEACVFSPNVGGYQGSDALGAGTCTFSDGAVSGVDLYAPADNGMP